MAGAQQYILDDVPKKIAKYGQNTAFFAEDRSVQHSLIKAVADEGGIYPQPCYPSPYFGYSRAFGLGSFEYGITPAEDVISETARILDEKGVLGRFSTWPVPYDFLAINTGVEYAIKWINGEVPKEGIDTAALQQVMEDYAGVECYLNAYEEDGLEYTNFLLVREDYLTYGKEHIK